MEKQMLSMSPLLIGAALTVIAGAAITPAMAADAPPKTVVLVHGAFADGSSWSKVIPLLEAKGLRVVAVQNPLSSLAADADAAKRVIDTAPGPVILVGHSWGGQVISQAGVNDKVKALVYVAAFALPKGQSVNGASAGGPPAPWLAELQPDAAGYVRLSDKAVATYFAQDLPAADIAVVAATQGPTFGGAFDDKLTEAAYLTRPSWYIVATKDGMIPPPVEEAMAAGIMAKVTAIEGSHVVMLSQPEAVAKVILEAADSVQ
jgi:pimeloyl-ACP methyl ester carboxylesterase